MAVVRLLHLSDTHGLHRSLGTPGCFDLPDADILLHTGDFTDRGDPQEVADFDAWLGELRRRGKFQHAVVILGNHEWKQLRDYDAAKHSGMLARAFAGAPAVRELLPSATVLEHETLSLMGLRIYGCGWCPWHSHGSPDTVDRGQAAKELAEARRRGGGDGRGGAGGGAGGCDASAAAAAAAGGAAGAAGCIGHDRYDEIPEGIDVLLTHCAPAGIFDQLEGSDCSWGSSRALRSAVERSRPRAHLFGHIHEQRGCWARPAGAPQQSGPYMGGVEYQAVPGEAWPTWPPPPPDYPCALISCNAMMNHPGLESSARGEHQAGRIAGPPRLVTAERATDDAEWVFRVEIAPQS